MSFEWNSQKAAANLAKHGVRFADAIAVFEDEFAMTMNDDDSDVTEQRFVTVGIDALGRVLVVVYTYRGETVIRIISARKATSHERRQYEEQR